MAYVGQIIKRKKDGTLHRVKEVFDDGTLDTDEVQATGTDSEGKTQYQTVVEPQYLEQADVGTPSLLNRLKVGITTDDQAAELAAWKKIYGKDNVTTDDAGDIYVYENGKWGPVEGQGISLTEMLGDIADYSGGLIKDAGSAIGGYGGAVLGVASPVPGGAYLGMVSGESVGRAAANLGRRAIGEALGVSEGEEDIATQTGSELIQGAGEAVVGQLGSKVIGKVAKTARPVLGAIVRETLPVIGGAATATSPKLISALSKEGGEEILDKFSRGVEGVDEGIEKVLTIPDTLKENANVTFGNTERDLGIDFQIPIDGTVKKRVLTEIRKNTADLEQDRLLTGYEKNFLRDILPNAIPILSDSPSVNEIMIIKGTIKETLKGTTNPSFKARLQRIDESLDDIILKDTGVGADKYLPWLEAVKKREDTLDVAKNLERFITKDPTSTAANIGRIEDKDMAGYFFNLNKAAVLEPEVKPLVDELILTSRGGRLANAIPSKPDDEVGKTIVDMLMPTYKGITSVLREPVYESAVGVGKALRGEVPTGLGKTINVIGKAGSGTRKVLGGATDLLTQEQVVREGARLAIGEGDVVDFITPTEAEAAELYSSPNRIDSYLTENKETTETEEERIRRNIPKPRKVLPKEIREQKVYGKYPIGEAETPEDRKRKPLGYYVTLEEVQPKLESLIKNNYGANFKRTTDLGYDDSEATLMVASDLVKKGKTAKLAQALGLTEEETINLLGDE